MLCYWGANLRKIKSLKDLIGDAWRITYDEAWEHESQEERQAFKIYYEIVKLGGGAGHLRLWSLEKKEFTVWTTKYKVAYDLESEYPEIKVVRMHNEVDMYFPLSMVDIVLTRLKGSRRKHFSEEWKAQNAIRMRQLHADGKLKKVKTKKSTRKVKSENKTP